MIESVMGLLLILEKGRIYEAHSGSYTHLVLVQRFRGTISLLNDNRLFTSIRQISRPGRLPL